MRRSGLVECWAFAHEEARVIFTFILLIFHNAPHGFTKLKSMNRPGVILSFLLIATGSLTCVAQDPGSKDSSSWVKGPLVEVLPDGSIFEPEASKLAILPVGQPGF
jgi:hypothetical protein